MRYSFPINVTLILRVLFSEDHPKSTRGMDQHELSRLLRYRLAVLEAASRGLVDLRHEAAKANLQLQSWIAGHIIQDVPSQIAMCEFGCSKSQCTSQEWHTCSRRLQAIAASTCEPSKV